VKKLVAIGLMSVSFCAQAVQYQLELLPALTTAPIAQGASAYGINESGQVVGTSYNSATGVNEAVTWGNGSVTSLGFEGVARAVNNSGTVVGETGGALLGNPNGRAFSWSSSGGFVDLGDLGGAHSGAYDINDSGVITGTSLTPDVPTGGEIVHGTRAFRYTGGVMTDLGNLAQNGYSRGHGINENGAIVGRASLVTFVDSEKHLATWDAANNMTSLPNAGSSIYSTGQQINNSGMIVGNGIDAAGEWRGMVWDSDGNFLNWIGTLGGSDSRAWSINNDGVIVGYADDPARGGLHSAMVSFDNGETIVDLNTLVTDLTGWAFLSEALDINENGEIVGYGYTSTFEKAAFKLSVVPIPGAVWLFISALGGLLGFRKLKQK